MLLEALLSVKADTSLLELLTRLQSTDKNCKFVHAFVHNLLYALKTTRDLDDLLQVLWVAYSRKRSWVG